MREAVEKLEGYLKRAFASEATGHDYHHMFHVRDMALRIAKIEGGNTDIIEIAALAHDIGDRKFAQSEAEGLQRTVDVLREVGVPDALMDPVMHIVKNISFKGAGVQEQMESLEGRIVQDADRLYALGAIGIARAFAYGGAKGRPMYDPDHMPETHASADAYYKSSSPTINHFYEKLLLLKDRMNTATGRKIAEERHAYIEGYLERFLREWEAKD